LGVDQSLFKKVYCCDRRGPESQVLLHELLLQAFA
jgi:hypothetical protein